MKISKSNLLAILFCFVAQYASAYSIYGHVIDRTDNSGCAGATVTVMTDSTNVLVQTIADEKGRFLVKDVSPTDVMVRVTYIGYKPQITAIAGNGENIDMSVVALDPQDVELGEVTVYGSSVMEKPDRYIVLPSVEEISRSAETMNLLSQLSMKMPGLRVNQMLQSATIDGRKPVYQINGKEESLQKVLTLNHNNILRIEYRNNPDIRYADRGAAGIINFVMKPKQEGGSFVADVNGSPMTGYLNAGIGGTYYNKKSEWSLNYRSSWRDYDDRYVGNLTEYIGRNEPVIRKADALPSTMSYFDNGLQLGYTYMHDINTMLSASVSLQLSESDDNTKNNITEITGSKITEYGKENANHSESVSPTANLYFRKTLKKQAIEVSLDGAMSNGDYNNSLAYDYYDGNAYRLASGTHNNSWSGGGEVLYSRFYNNFTVRYGVDYRHNHVENEYSENDGETSITELNKDNLYVYGDIAGKLKKLGYSVGIGGKYFRQGDTKRSRDDFKVKSTVTLNYRLTDQWSLNYLFMYDPSTASLSSLSEEVHTVNDILLSTGNLNLKPSEWHRNRLFIRYNGRKFTATAWGSFSRTNNPVVNVYRYVSDTSSPYYNMFMRSTENGWYDNTVNLQLNLGWQNILDHFSIYGIIGWDDFKFVGNGYNERRDRMYANVSANAFWGNWTVFADFDILPQYRMSGNSMSESARFNSIGVQYRYNKWFFKCFVANPFTRRGYKTENFTVSDVRPSYNETYIKDNANMVVLGVTYRTNFGKSMKKANRSLNSKDGVDTGVRN